MKVECASCLAQWVSRVRTRVPSHPAALDRFLVLEGMFTSAGFLLLRCVL
jgi:hypothetical protein